MKAEVTFINPCLNREVVPHRIALDVKLVAETALERQIIRGIFRAGGEEEVNPEVDAIDYHLSPGFEEMEVSLVF